MNVYIKTFGCSANVNDSEIMAGLLERAGCITVSDIKLADAIIVNTCIVKGKTENKVKNFIQKAVRNFSKKRLVIAGCMPAAQLQLVKDLAPKAAYINPNNVKDIAKALAGKSFTKKEFQVKLGLPKIRKNSAIDIVQIAEGCSQFCSYCIVKLAKGQLHSYPENLIIKEVKAAVSAGCKEIWITSQDNAAYGIDTETNLAKLLNKIASLPGSFKIRVGMMNPNNALQILDELIAVFKHKKVFKFLHLPVQSGNNEILRRMNRSYKAEDFEKIVERFREEIPDITISTDIICGFPEETKKQFKDSVELIKRIKPDVLNVSRFWPRPGTAAAKLEQISGVETKIRSQALSKIFTNIAIEKNKKWIGWKGPILIDEKGKFNAYVGRNFAYKPIVIKEKPQQIGKELEVSITGATKYYLVGN